MKAKQTPEVCWKYFPNAEQVGGEYYIAYKAFIEGIKYQQQKSYSVEEVVDLIKKQRARFLWQGLTTEEWFEQFKNKYEYTYITNKQTKWIIYQYKQTFI
jgi:DeoR/GlpR family transcriptional regulator of sugar metabolism